MILNLPTQEQVDQIAKSLAPDVVRIRMRDGLDWADYPALYFYVILSDAVRPRLHEVTNRVREHLRNDLSLLELAHTFYVRFRTESEQRQLQERLWD